ncbi:hypothetical protein D3C84_1241830 [compost metagenome]
MQLPAAAREKVRMATEEGYFAPCLIRLPRYSNRVGWDHSMEGRTPGLTCICWRRTSSRAAMISGMALANWCMG